MGAPGKDAEDLRGVDSPDNKRKGGNIIMVDEYGIDWDEVGDIMRPYKEEDEKPASGSQESKPRN